MAISSDMQEHEQEHDRDYAGFLAAVRYNFEQATQDPKVKLFEMRSRNKQGDFVALDLFDEFLARIPAQDRQVHNCNTCRSFFKHFGAVVTIDSEGVARSALWDADSLEGYYERPVDYIRRVVEAGEVYSTFSSDERQWGIPADGPWTHVSVKVPAHLKHDHLLLEPSQVNAARREEFKILRRAMGEVELPVIETALRLLESEALYRAEKVIGPAKFLRDLKIEHQAEKNTLKKNNIIWRALASAPEGFAKPRQAMVWTLFEDIQAGMDFGAVSMRFADKMDATKYQRPQSAPGAGNIKQAEKIIAKLGAAGALQRKYATLAEIQCVWTPQTGEAGPDTEAAESVFGHLTAKGAKKGEQISFAATSGMPSKLITFEKFIREIVPIAEEMELYVTSSPMNFSAYVTAADMDAVPIIQWDTEEFRNPVTWYVYRNGSPARTWGLQPSAWTRVTAISFQPTMWNRRLAMPHHGEGALFVLAGARDTNWTHSGAGLFPEHLRSELREVRKTLEAHSHSMTIAGYEESNACGLRITKGHAFGNLEVRIKSRGLAMKYKIDRWD